MSDLSGMPPTIRCAVYLDMMARSMEKVSGTVVGPETIREWADEFRRWQNERKQEGESDE